MTHWLLIIRYKSLSFRRWLKANSFTLFILGPIILAGFYVILEPYLITVAGRLHAAAATWRAQDLYPASFALTILLVAFPLSSTLKEVYSTHSADSYLDALSIRAITRFNVTLFFRVLKNLPAWVALLVVLHGIGGERTADSAWLRIYAPLTLAVFCNIALLQMLAVLVLVHDRLFGAGRLPAQAATLLTLTVLTKWHQLFLLPLLPFVTLAVIFKRTLGEALSLTGEPSATLRTPWSHLVLTATLYVLALLLYKRWRNDDREQAREALIRQHTGRSSLTAWLRRWLDRPVAAQVVRDWQLTRRGFSSAVYLAVGFAVLFQSIVVLAARRHDLSSEWFSTIAQVSCAFSVLSLTALAPLLIKYQLPYFWVEKATGLSPEAIWKAKFWYARLLAVPAFVMSVLVITPMSPLDPTDQALFILKLLIIAFMVASLMGVMAFEIASRPLLGLIFSGLAALAMAGLFIFYWIAWPLWLYGYVVAMHSLSRRAQTKVRFTEVET